MRYLLIIVVILGLSNDSTKLEKPTKIVVQQQRINKSLDSLSVKMDSMLMFLKNDTTK